MDTYNTIEKLIADQYGRTLGTRKAIGDFMLTDSHAVNVKSNNVRTSRTTHLTRYNLGL